ncbi:MAG: dUTP diphosphatase [bacterium]
MQIRVKKLIKDAKLPTRSHFDDAGMDIYSTEEVVIHPGEYHPIKTGIALEIPYSFVGLVWEKSGLAHKGIKTVGGVIDAGYRGEIMIQLRNFSNVDYQIQKGDKVAQLIIQKIEIPELVEVAELTETQRGEGRFGSTGVK